jgi:hypothetical protein
MNWIEMTLLAIDAIFVLLALWLFLFRKGRATLKRDAAIERSVAGRVIWVAIVLAVNAGFLWSDPKIVWPYTLLYLPLCYFAISFPILDLWRSRKNVQKKRNS